MMNTSITPSDPFDVLGVPKNADEAEIRARYLELVKRFPPERDPDKFREVRAAFEAAKDPLLIAQRLLEPPSDEAPRWSDAIEEQKRIPPALTPTLLLSLGNRDDAYRPRPDEAKLDASEALRGQATDSDPNQKQHFVEQAHE
jgi:curved DNA-binding protein CbpA